MSIIKINLGHLKILGVFRHRWDNPEHRLVSDSEWRMKQLGVFFKKTLCVGTSKKGKEMFEKDYLRPSYMFGINLIWVKMWIEVSWKALTL
jgi:hypothetical protein